MAQVITTVAELVNLALGRIGYAERIGNIYEGSKAARIALDIYGQTRDALLRDGDYGFAERNINMVLLKQAPATGYAGVPWDGTQFPPPPWVFEYQYPVDCLKVRSIKPAPVFVIDFDPQPFVFAVENDNFLVPSQKVILCNAEAGQLVYTAQVTNPSQWEVDFIEELSDALAERLAPLLATPDTTKMAAAETIRSKSIADAEQG